MTAPFKYSLVAQATIALSLGLSGTLTIVVLINAVVLRPLPYAESEQLVEVWDSWEGAPRVALTAPEFFSLRESASRPESTLQAVCAWVHDSLVLTLGGEPRKITVLAATHDIFDVLEIDSALGRPFTADEDRPGAEPVVLLSHRFWTRHHGADPAILGRRLELDGTHRTVIGVLPQGLRMPRTYVGAPRADLWIPAQLQPQFTVHYFNVLARLQSDRSLGEVRPQLDRAAEQSGTASTRSEYRMFASSLHGEIVGEAGVAAPILAGAAVVVFVVSVFIATLLWMTYELHRLGETRARWALGATVAQLGLRCAREVVGAATIAVVAALLMTTLVLWCLRLTDPGTVPRLEDARLSGSTAVLATGLAALAASLLLVGATGVVRRGIGNRKRTTTSSHLLGRSALGTFTAATLGATLVVSSGMVVKSLIQLETARLGFASGEVLTGVLELAASPGSDRGSARRLVAELEKRIGRLPEVQAFGVSSSVPFKAREGSSPGRRVAIEGEAEHIEQGTADLVVVSPGAFNALGVQVAQGRPFTDADNEDAADVAIINEAFARTLFPNRRPIGARIDLGRQQRARPGSRTYVPVSAWTRIVGVVPDTRFSLRRAPKPTIFVPHAQRGSRTTAFVARHSGDAGAAVRAIRRTIRDAAPEAPLEAYTELDSLRAQSLALPRFLAIVGLAFASMGGALTLLAIRASVRHDLLVRTRELALRRAVGARPTQLLRVLLTKTLRWTAAGTALGLAVGSVLSVPLEATTFGVQRVDSQVLVIAALVMASSWTVAVVGPTVTCLRSVDASDLLRAS